MSNIPSTPTSPMTNSKKSWKFPKGIWGNIIPPEGHWATPIFNWWDTGKLMIIIFLMMAGTCLLQLKTEIEEDTLNFQIERDIFKENLSLKEKKCAKAGGSLMTSQLEGKKLSCVLRHYQLSEN